MDITIKTTSYITYKNVDDYFYDIIETWKEDIKSDEDFDPSDPEKRKGYLEDLESYLWNVIFEDFEYDLYMEREETSESDVEKVYKQIKSHFKKEIDDALSNTNN